MPSNEQRRQAAKRKLERQIQRREEQAKRRRVITVGATIAVVFLLVVGVFYFTRETPPPPVACGYQPTPEEPAAKPVGLPPDPAPTPSQGTVPVALKTSQGTINLTLDRAKAPCAAQSFQHLVQSKYFDGTDCHRLTTDQGLKVLQCGDPTGTGRGGPGYTIKDEPPKDLKPAPGQAESRIYPRGTLAMAKKSQPNTGGSQFFMVYQDSYLPPDYAVFGTIGDAGLAVLDKVAAAGAKPENEQGATAPNLPVHIDQAAVAS